MPDNKEYSNLSIEELVVKQKSLPNRKNIYITIAMVLVLNTLFAIYKNNIGMFHSISIIISLFFITYNSNELKKIDLEIKNRKL
jgi:small basic protein